jgi:tetratricopeptide (TPR) repeat protein
VNRVQGRYAEARHYYEDALKVQRNLDDPREYADLLNNMGNVLRLQGKLEDALRLCKLGLRIRRDLLAQGKGSEYDAGLSWSTLGHIYHTLGEVNEEERAYKEAFDIYNRVGDRSAIAGTCNCLGRVWMQRKDFRRADEYFQQARRIASGVSLLAEIESYNQLGRLTLLQEQWDVAIGYFEPAVVLSRHAGMEFQLAENLLYLAQAYDGKGKPFQEQIREAKRIARTNDFGYLLARAGEIQGDLYLKKREYLRASKGYVIACRYMAERSSLEFERMLRRLNDILLGMPASYLPGVIDTLLSYWYEWGLDKHYPELPVVCREVSRHMLL